MKRLILILTTIALSSCTSRSKTNDFKYLENLNRMIAIQEAQIIILNSYDTIGDSNTRFLINKTDSLYKTYKNKLKIYK